MNNTFLSQPIKAEIAINVENQDYYMMRVNIPDSQVIEWCLSLMLLQHNLIKEVRVKDGQSRLILRFDDRINRKNKRIRIKPFIEGNTSVRLRIVAEELENWLLYYLYHLRDGISRIDHFDVGPLEIDNDKQRRFYLTFWTDNWIGNQSRDSHDS